MENEKVRHYVVSDAYTEFFRSDDPKIFGDYLRSIFITLCSSKKTKKYFIYTEDFDNAHFKLGADLLKKFKKSQLKIIASEGECTVE